jgi:hypothetical protein
MMGIVSPLREFVHARHDASRSGRHQEAEAYARQIESIERRAAIIQRSFLFSLTSLALTIFSCLLLGLGLYEKSAAFAAAIVFVLAMVCLLIGVLHYFREMMVALSSVRDEARDLGFMDIGSRPESRQPDPQ